MVRPLRTLGLILLTLAAGACASASAGAGQRSDRNLLTMEQIQDTNRQNVYDVVEMLRSNWLRERGATSIQGPNATVQVYLDDNRIGGVENLRAISIAPVRYIRWIDGISATGRWGLDHGAGVIFVSTRDP